MKILLVYNTSIPALKYGGTERVIWSLGKTLTQLKHQVAFLVKKPSYCPFAKVFYLNNKISIQSQFEKIHKEFSFDIISSFLPFKEEISFPYLVSVGGNGKKDELFPRNTTFVSKNHAERHGSKHYIYNGMDWNDYPSFKKKSKNRSGFSFLSDIKRPEKNLKSALEIAKTCQQNLIIMGGKKLNFNSQIKYLGMVDNKGKAAPLNSTQALLFPILWHEPFGIAVIESMYYGCPVFATSYGSMPELINPQVGLISDKKSDWIDKLNHLADLKFNENFIHEYVVEKFSALPMTKNYLKYYEKILNGETLNPQFPQAKFESDRNHLLSFFD